MTDEQLKSALIEVRDHMLTQFPVAEKDCGFSPKFHRKMRQLIEMEKHPLLYQMCRIVAAILIALGISGGLVLGFSEEARAEIVRWFVERFTNNEYRYQNNMGAIELYWRNISWLTGMRMKIQLTKHIRARRESC